MGLISFLRDTREYIQDKKWIDQEYYYRFGRHVNWVHPTRFTEKIQLFKLSKEAEKLWIYVDKFQVRSYVERQIGPEYLTKLYGVYNDPKEIDFDALPQSFALKTTHGSGWNILCRDKSLLDQQATRKQLAEWLAQNFYHLNRERQYKLIRPKIICEEYLETDDKTLYDFKFYCFHGEPRIINVIQDRSGKTKKAFYELPWEKSVLQPWEAQADLNLDRPNNLDKMLEISRKLSQPFGQVRVDLYQTPNRIIFGELTFSCSSGFKPYDPDRYDVLLGSYW